MPRDFAHESHFPGATTCIVIGGDHAPTDIRFARYKAIAWYIDRARAVGWSIPSHTQAIAINEPAAVLLSRLEQFLRLDPRHLPSLYVGANVGIPAAAAGYARILATVQRELENHHRARLTRQKDGFTWQRHLLQNLPAYAARRVPAEWQGALRGWPAFVCGAGPSLDVSAPILAQHAKHGVVFSADSALRTLARHGIKADFAVSIDAAKVPEKCLPEPRFHPSRVVLSGVSPPAWTSPGAPPDYAFLASRQVTLDWAATHDLPKTPLNVGESCGATALALAHFLGCAPIHLFGLDLAVAADRPAARHAAGADATLYTDSGYHPSPALPRVPGNYEDTVPTFARPDWHALNELLGAWPENLVHNVNDRGARFANTTLVHPRDFPPVSPAIANPPPWHRLAPADAIPARRFQGEMRAQGQRAVEAVASLRAALRHSGPAGAAAGFRSFFGHPGAAPAFGAFAFKLMPHLFPPLEDDAAFWQTLIDEFEILAATAAAK